MYKIKSLGTGEGKRKMYKRGKKKRERTIKGGLSFNKTCFIFVKKTNPQYTAKNLTAKLK